MRLSTRLNIVPRCSINGAVPSGVARFWSPGRVVTFAAPNRNWDLKKSHLSLNFPLIWLNNSQFVDGRKSNFLFDFPPLRLCLSGRLHHPTPPSYAPIYSSISPIHHRDVFTDNVTLIVTRICSLTGCNETRIGLRLELELC